jgi:hypothetical protein
MVQRKIDVSTLLGAALVALGHRNFAGASDRLQRSRAMIKQLAEQKAILLEEETWPELTFGTTSGITSLVVSAITGISKNNLQDAYTKVRDAGLMLGKMVEERNARRQRAALP